MKRHITAPATAAQIQKAIGLTAADMALIEDIASKSSPFKHQKKVSRTRR